VGLAIVNVIGEEAPAMGFSDVSVMKFGGICTSMVPVWPIAVGAVSVDVTGTETPLIGFSNVIVVNGSGT
jgi:hypothetical protein